MEEIYYVLSDTHSLIFNGLCWVEESIERIDKLGDFGPF